ncbi:MAG: hypothetical protein DRQ02_01415 [Candidatus Latescibacterota bacterium]|nr:MAG: hypothetical protein DRQ02_01415 [Candidatus Latescibacterota bacterium]
MATATKSLVARIQIEFETMRPRDRRYLLQYKRVGDANWATAPGFYGDDGLVDARRTVHNTVLNADLITHGRVYDTQQCRVVYQIEQGQQLL